MRTIEDLKREKEALFKKHPGLRDVQVLPLRESWSYEKLSALIELCFNHDYGNSPRIRFTPEFLEWSMPIPSGVCVLDDEDRWLGCFLAFSRDCSHGGQAGKYAIETALCTIPEMRGRGLAQLLNLSYREVEFTSGPEFSVCWVDSRDSHDGGSKLVLERMKEASFGIQTFNLICKTLDCRKARIHE